VRWRKGHSSRAQMTRSATLWVAERRWNGAGAGSRESETLRRPLRVGAKQARRVGSNGGLRNGSKGRDRLTDVGRVTSGDYVRIFSQRRAATVRRLIVWSVVAVLFPYTSARCLSSLEGGCHLPSEATREATRSHAHASSDHAAHASANHSQHGSADDHGPPDRTCCEITGKTAFPSASSISQLDLTILPALVSRGAFAHSLGVARVDQAHRIARSHGPPVYLRNVTLLI